MPKESAVAKSNGSTKAASKEDATSSPKAPKGTSGARPFRIKDVDTANFELSEVTTTGQQPVCFLNYHDSKKNNTVKSFMIQTGFIHFSSHGIPRISDDSKYYKTDANREFCKIPLFDDTNDKDKIPENQASRELRECLIKIDEYMASDAVKKQIAKKFKKRVLVYKPLVRTPKSNNDEDDDDDDDEDNSKKKKSVKKGKDGKEKKEYPIVDFCKAKYSFSGEKEERKCETSFYKSESVKDKNEPEKTNFDTMTEVDEALGYGHYSRFVIYFNKVWIDGSDLEGIEPPTRRYGLGLKIVTQQYVPGNRKGGGVKNISFVAEDSADEDETPAKPSGKGKDKPKGKQPKLDSDDENDEDKPPTKGTEDSDVEDSEDEDSGKKGKGKNKGKAPVKDSDDEDEDSEPKGGKGGKTKPKTKEPESDNEDEDSEPEVKPKGGKGGKTKPKTKEPESDNEDEDSEPEVKPKGVKGGKTKPKTKEPESDNEDEEEDDEEIKVSKKKGKAGGKKVGKEKKE
jgi:hypothetical protein